MILERINPSYTPLFQAMSLSFQFLLNSDYSIHNFRVLSIISGSIWKYPTSIKERKRLCCLFCFGTAVDSFKFWFRYNCTVIQSVTFNCSRTLRWNIFKDFNWIESFYFFILREDLFRQICDKSKHVWSLNWYYSLLKLSFNYLGKWYSWK